ncbi:MAG: lytic murein transglycosylase [Hydrogenophaga sp.]
MGAWMPSAAFWTALLLSPMGAAALAQTPRDLSACLAELQAPARQAGVSAATWRTHTTGLLSDPRAVAALNTQPEFSIPIWDYLAVLVDEERVAQGQAMLTTHADVLKRVHARHSVDPATVVAVWGVESNYGQGFGRFPIVQALATLSCEGRRQTFFRGELFAALRIVQAGHFPAEQFVGSWAGAFGHTQFMPTTFERLAVDFDGDGRADLMGNTADALASTANFLQRAGWQDGQVWGFEVRVPKGAVPDSGEGRRVKRDVDHWRSLGLRRIDGSALPANLPKAGLMRPAGPQGPAFLVMRNFDAVFSYNAAESYGLAIAHLADRLRGGQPFATAWPTDDPGLSRADRRSLQTLLLMRGHDIGEVDGALGEKSRAAIRAEQARLGWTVDGRAGQRLLQTLRQP